jgi:hypothetical protein
MVGVVGSNPIAPTKHYKQKQLVKKIPLHAGFFIFFRAESLAAITSYSCF